MESVLWKATVTRRSSRSLPNRILRKRDRIVASQRNEQKKTLSSAGLSLSLCEEDDACADEEGGSRRADGGSGSRALRSAERRFARFSSENQRVFFSFWDTTDPI